MRCTQYEIEFESTYYKMNGLLIDILNWTYMKYYMLLGRSDIPILCWALVVEDSTVIIHPWDQFIHANTNGISRQDGSFSSDVLIKFDLRSFHLLFIQIVPIAIPKPCQSTGRCCHVLRMYINSIGKYKVPTTHYPLGGGSWKAKYSFRKSEALCSNASALSHSTSSPCVSSITRSNQWI